jgi:hypothetical protein
MRKFSNPMFSDCLSRRDLLLGASSGVAVSLAGAALPAWSESLQAGAAANPAALRRSIAPASMPKAWSAEESRHRWQSVRQGMKDSHKEF